MAKSIGQYQLLKRIGAGGMAVVYLGKHSVLGTRVAVKVLLENMTRDQTLRTRFMNEARIMAGLKHPNIVNVVDFLEAGKRLVLVMEYIEGNDLSAMIGSRTGPIPYQKALPLFRQIVEAVEYAHDKGVVHRDLKPSNILVDDSGTAKVTDFGIAKVAGQTSMTRTGTKLGTLCYMSPEQVLGKESDQRADIYSLGATLYEMLAGVMPRSGERTSEYEIMKDIVENDLPDPRSFYPHIPEWLVGVLSDALAREPGKRISSCAEFLKRLEQGEAGVLEPASAISASTYGESSPDTPAAGVGSRQAAGMAEPSPVVSSGKRRRWIWIPIVLGLGALGGFVLPGIIGSSETPDDTTVESEVDPRFFERTYGGSRDDVGWDVALCSDGGYIMAGYTDAYGDDLHDIMLVNLDGEGEEVWRRTYDESNSDQSFSVVQTADGGYAAAGFCTSPDLNDDAYVIKVDAEGRQLWDRKLTGAGTDWAFAILENTSGDLVIAGTTSPVDSEETDAFFARLSSSGTVRDTEVYDLSGSQYIYDIVQCSDDGYALLGRDLCNAADNGDILLLRLDSTGDMEWSRRYGGDADEWGRSIITTSDGGFVIAGYTSSYGSGGDAWLLKLSSTGTVRWRRNIGGAYKDWAYCVRSTSDGGYVLAAKTESYGSGGFDAWLVKTDSDGEVRWHRSFGGREDDRAYSIEVTDTGFILGGSNSSTSSGTDDFFLISTDSDGQIVQ